MVQNIKIGPRQFRKLVILFTVGNSILFLPTLLAEEAKQDAWIASIIGVGGGLLLVWFYQTVARLFPTMTFAEYIPTIFGKWLGRMIVLLFFAFSFGLSIILLRSLGDFMTITTLPETPKLAVHIFFLGVVMLGAIYGLENIVRTCEICIPWLYIFMLLFFLLVMTDIKLDNVRPVFEQGLVPILNGSFLLISSTFLELVLFLVIYPQVKIEKNTKNHFLLGAAMGGGILIVSSFLVVSILGAEETATQLYPIYILSQQIKIENVIRRIEGLLSAIWIVTIYFKLLICFYISVISLTQTLGLKNYRLLSLPLAVILVTLSIKLFSDINHFIEFMTKIWPSISLGFGLLLPLILLLVWAIKTKVFKLKK
ncbi:GerAB/ArcD/ProY family transporter [Alkalihalobacillus deserti]|uniref:GerAB/ArcD/ProY family transporter n=1 Tax=Alkalihalobacillus deserti TaxID=2879466 RepID=UPI001D15366D|nr:endospore germination permease [Alkalihalobacillus deserti]